LDEISELKGLLFGGPIKAKDNVGKVGHPIEVPEDVSKNGKIGGIRVLTCQQRDDQDRFLPP